MRASFITVYLFRVVDDKLKFGIQWLNTFAGDANVYNIVFFRVYKIKGKKYIFKNLYRFLYKIKRDLLTSYL